MKAFRFSLQALLTLRKRSEHKALEAYAAALGQQRQARGRLAEVERAQAEFWQTRRERMGQPCSGGTFQQWQASEYRLTESRDLALAELHQANAEVSRTLQEMLAARRDREAVQKQLERKLIEYGRERNRDEQKTMDELAQRRGLAPAAPQPELTVT